MRIVGFIAVALMVTIIGVSQLLHPIRITYDGGGNVGRYVNDAFVMAVTKRHLEVDGPCLSACLLFFHHDYNIPICVTARAVLGFHYPFPVNDHGDLVVATKAMDSNMKTLGDHMISGLPRNVQKSLLAQHLPRPTRGDPVNELALVGYDVLKQAYPDCEPQPS